METLLLGWRDSSFLLLESDVHKGEQLREGVLKLCVISDDYKTETTKITKKREWVDLLV